MSLRWVLGSFQIQIWKTVFRVKTWKTRGRETSKSLTMKIICKNFILFNNIFNSTVKKQF